MHIDRQWNLGRIIVLCLALLGVAAIAAACGDDDDATDAGTDSGTDTDTDSDSDADGSLEVLVLSQSAAEEAPAEGALVTFDKPGGERVELTTGADGTVAFDGIDWSLGAAAATASMDGHGMASRVGLTEADGAIALRLRVEQVETVTLSGTVTNMSDESHGMGFVYYGCGGGEHWDSGPEYAMEVPVGVPFGLGGFEYTWQFAPSGQGQEWTIYNHYWQEMDAIAADTTYDVTFEADGGVETTEVSGSFDFSTTEGTPISGTAGTGGVYVMIGCDRYPLWVDGGGWMGTPVGYTSHSDINAEGTAFDYTVEYMEPPFADEYFTTYFVYLWTGDFMGSTEVREAGVPTPGSHAIDLLDVPVVNVSSETGFVELNGVPVTWESADTDARPELVVFVGDSTWIIGGPVGATSLAVPAPPAGAALAEPIESSVHEAVLTLLRDAADSTPELWLGARSYSQAMAAQYVP